MSTKRDRDQGDEAPLVLPPAKFARIEEEDEAIASPLAALLSGEELPELLEFISPAPVLDPALRYWSPYELYSYLRDPERSVLFTSRLAHAFVSRSTYTLLGAAVRPVLAQLARLLWNTGMKDAQDVLDALGVILEQPGWRIASTPLAVSALVDPEGSADLKCRWGLAGIPFRRMYPPPRSDSTFVQYEYMMRAGSSVVYGETNKRLGMWGIFAPVRMMLRQACWPLMQMPFAISQMSILVRYLHFEADALDTRRLLLQTVAQNPDARVRQAVEELFDTPPNPGWIRPTEFEMLLL